MVGGDEGVTLYERAIEVMEKEGNKNQAIASAFASIAELFMTQPLCDEEGAE